MPRTGASRHPRQPSVLLSAVARIEPGGQRFSAATGNPLRGDALGRNVQNMSQRDTCEPEVKLLRSQLGLSQEELARKLGYSPKTIYRWERGEGKPRVVVMERLRSELSVPPTSGTPSFRFVDLFAGIGGLRRGFEGIGGKCVFTSEWDKYAVATYRANFHCDHDIAGDIVQVPSEAVPEHDVLLAGFPCQPFSIAGVSKKNSLGRAHGFACETQGTLFFEVARILRHHQPRAFLLENVRNLASHDGGRTFRTIRDVLTLELGYHLHWKVLDARPFVPQQRHRIFLVGIREDNDFSWDDLQLPNAAEGPLLRSVLHPEDGSELPEEPYTLPDGRVSPRYRLSPHLWRYLRDYASKHKAKGNGFGYGLVGPDDVARTLSARYYKDGSEILIRTSQQTPRRLTPRECARLMGFDAAGSASFVIPVSDTQAYKQFGNAVVPPLVGAIAEAMRPYVTGSKAPSTQLSLPLRLRAG
jgi:DNA (cytosine-5)-methyltransferase 1